MSQAISEASFQADVIRAAKLMGLAVYHTYDSRRSESGYPDLTIVGRHGVIFRELKTAKGRVTSSQQFWLDCLTAAGGDAKVWRPADWPSIIAELQALGRTTVASLTPSQKEVRRQLAKRAR